MSRVCIVPAALPTDPCALFDFALEQLTWEHVRDLLPLDEPGRSWTVATAGPLSLLARAATDHTASLNDWTTREDSPGLFAAADSAQLWHLGLMVEVACSGVLLAHESLWACCLDCSTHTTERDSYAHFLDVIKQLSREACAYAPSSIATKMQQLSSASAVILGLEEPYHRSLGF
jgi:hypothetical protein